MSRFHSYISSASEIINTYKGASPLAQHLKTFFFTRKKYGSRDRKIISSLCYSYFRTGHALKSHPVEEKILAGLFLSEDKSNDMLALFRPEWNSRIDLAVSDKLSLLDINLPGIFPFIDQLGDGIDKSLFTMSFLSQPDLYLRIRPGKKKQVIDKLDHGGISFEEINEDCLKFANKSTLDTVVQLNKEAVIQDYNSQQVLGFLVKNHSYFPGENKTEAWDCCAASGGKSILLYDVLKGNVKITVSDIRENILFNLDRRLQQAGINIYKKFIADISENTTLSQETVFPLIICDAPCTGSGTWSRTPEQLFYFDEKFIDLYAEKQKKIVSNIIPHLVPGGLLFYITCSVFKKENEELVAYIKEKFHLPLLQMEYLKGYDKKADTMFVAVFSA